MGIFGADVSNHQRSFDFRGWDFAFIKSSEGNGFRDAYFAGHLANAKAAGCLVAAYHYQRDVSASSQVALIESMVPRDVPVIIDVEHGSGSLSITREIVRMLLADGYNVPLLYLPRWYWNSIGQPLLDGLPALWASWYPDYVGRTKEQGIAKVPDSAWASYGGLPVVLMQFTSTPFDQNWFPGSRDELAAILNGRAPGGGGIGVDEVSWNEELTSHTGYKAPAHSWLTMANFKAELAKDTSERVEAKVDALAQAVEDIQVGGIDYDLLADKVAKSMLKQLDVDLVSRPQTS